MFLEAGGKLRLKVTVMMGLLLTQLVDLDDLQKLSLVHYCRSVSGRVSAKATVRTVRKKMSLRRAIGFGGVGWYVEGKRERSFGFFFGCFMQSLCGLGCSHNLIHTSLSVDYGKKALMLIARRT